MTQRPHASLGGREIRKPKTISKRRGQKMNLLGSFDRIDLFCYLSRVQR